MQNIAADLSDHISGTLHIGCLQTVAPVALPQLRKSFEAACPEVRVCQIESHQAGLLAALQSAAIDLCLTYDLDIPSDVDFFPLADLPAFVMLPAKHRLASRASLAAADLADEPLILLDLPLSSKYFLSMFEKAGVSPRIAERSKDMALVRSMVANGFGYSLGNIRPISDMAPDGRKIKHVPLKNGLRPMRLGLASCRTDYATRASRAFRDHCAAMIAECSLPGLASRGR